MSPSSPSTNDLKTALAESDALPSLTQYSTGLKAGVTRIAFWSAIVLPFLHVPLLVTGLEETSVRIAFVSLLLLNVVAAILGQHHSME